MATVLSEIATLANLSSHGSGGFRTKQAAADLMRSPGVRPKLATSTVTCHHAVPVIHSSAMVAFSPTDSTEDLKGISMLVLVMHGANAR
jgi:glutamate 5-kinase